MNQDRTEDSSVTPSGTIPPGGAVFVTTRWTLVVRARGESPEARVALSELCETYYEPVLRFLLREGRNEDAARELAQEFFARILSSRGFDGAVPERGRFRSYVLGALKHFLADARDRELRLKRGGGVIPESLSPANSSDTSCRQVADPSAAGPEAEFDRGWALTIMARALEILHKEMRSEGKADQFDCLKPWLMGDGPSLSQAQAARQLGLTEGAVKVTVHRLRKRFREIVRGEIAQTLRDPKLVDEELRHLVAALS